MYLKSYLLLASTFFLVQATSSFGAAPKSSPVVKHIKPVSQKVQESAPVEMICIISPLMPEYIDPSRIQNKASQSATRSKKNVGQVITSTDLKGAKAFYSHEQQREVSDKEVLENLIDQKIQLQIGEILNLTPKKEIIDKEIEEISKRMGKSIQQLEKEFNAKGIPLDFLRDHLRSQIIWRQYIPQKFDPMANISELDAKVEQERLKKKMDEKAYQLVEIYLDVPQGTSRDAVLKKAKSIREEVKNVGIFREKAFTVSKSKTAPMGGYLGWIFESELPSAFKDQVLSMQPRTVSPVIQSEDGFYILYLREIKQEKQNFPSEDKVTLAHIILPVKPQMTMEEIQKFEGIAKELMETKNCAQMTSIAKKNHLQIDTHVKTIEELNDSMHTIVRTTPVGKTISDGINFLKVCSLEPAKLEEPKLDDIKNKLRFTKLEELASKELQRLKKLIFIDYKKSV